MVKMAQWTFGEVQITNIEIKSDALLEIAAGMHSPFCPNLADFSACVPPALQKGFSFYFNIGDLDFSKDPLWHFYQWNAWHIFFVSVQARNSSVLGLFDDIFSDRF